jgi:hypothetical protein
MTRVRRSRAGVALDVWVCALAAVLCLPALTHSGLGLGGDLVFSPRQPLTLDTVGLGSRMPRAVPIDAVIGLVGYVLPGAVLFRIAILAGLVLAGCAAHRLARLSGCGALPGAAAATFAVWNPFTVERMALGQWALVLAYGALSWVVLRVIGWRHQPAGAPWAVWGWVGLASLTPTGGILAVVVAVVLGARSRAATLVLATGCCALQLPWLLPSLLRTATAGGDSTGVTAFRAGPDAPGGTLVSLLGLGGIWDLDSVPTSRTSLLGILAAVLVVAALVAAWRRMPTEGRRLLGLGVGGLLLALAPRVPGLEEAFRWIVVHVPGGGLLRDSQKWLAPLVVVAAWSAGIAVDRLSRRLRRSEPALPVVVGVVALLLPLVVLPDAAAATWGTVRPVRYPDDFARVRDRLVDEGAGPIAAGAMVLLPWRAYRAFDWGNDRTANDPAWAWFDVPMVGSSTLAVGRREVEDEDPGAAALRRAAVGPGSAERLARLGVRWVLVYPDDPATPDLDLSGLEPVVAGHDVRLYRVPGALVVPPGQAPWRRVVVIGSDLLVLAGWLAACGLAWGRRPPDNVRATRARRRAGTRRGNCVDDGNA